MNGMAVAARSGERLRLDHNERLFPAPELVRLLPKVPASTLTRYPDASRLERRLAEAMGTEPDRVLVRGGDDAIDRACRRCLSGGREGSRWLDVEMGPMFAASRAAGAARYRRLKRPSSFEPIYSTDSGYGRGWSP